MSHAIDSDGEFGPRGREVRARLAEKTKRSRALSAKTHELMNMGSAASLEMPHPVLMERGEGPYLFDADGNKYIDFQIGFGSLILGHRHPVIQEAILDQAENRGWQFGLHNPNQIPLAELIIKADNCAERVIFCNSGTEATMYAIRVARAFTGKDKVAVFDGSYHGAHDYGIGVADPESPREAPVYRSMGAGVPQSVRDRQLMLPYRSDAAFDIIRANKDELAVVIVEPAQSSNPHMGDDIKEFLAGLREVCTQSGVLLMYDEVITGFRFSYGGAQELYGVYPDIATYGKAVGGGLPVGVVGGRGDIMALFNSMAAGDPKGIMSGGTFSGNPLTMAAGAAQVGYFDEHRETLYPHINLQGGRLAEGINGFARDNNMAVQVLSAGSMFQIYFKADPIRSSRDLAFPKPPAETEFYLHLLDNGVLVPGTRRSFVSYVHTAADIDDAVERVKTSLMAVREDGLI